MTSATRATMLACLLAAAAGALAPDARAEVMTKWMIVNGSGACQSALPVFDVNIRKRPKAVQNEGDAPAFVTCSYYMQGPAKPFRTRIYFASNDGQADSLTCTGVLGGNGDMTAYAAKTVQLSANGTQSSIDWRLADFVDGVDSEEPFPSGLFGISCNLNPGVGVNDAYIYFNEEIGK